ncbi:hypothetical protein M3Y96_00163700 [Aphelenchoides besseyi]|nr:hypothetical protein M3Y96_00163700 [Aphelenchoides besseyi]
MWSRFACFGLLLVLNPSGTDISSAFASDPCDGRIVVVLDDPPTWYNGFTTKMFNRQKDLLIELFARPYFYNFERLALGYLSENETLTNFNHFHSESDVANYINAVQQDSTSIFQNSGPQNVYEKNYLSVPGDKITIVFLYLIFMMMTSTMNDQGVHVVMIGHSIGTDYYYIYSRLVEVTNDPFTVFNWDASKHYQLPGAQLQVRNKQQFNINHPQNRRLLLLLSTQKVHVQGALSLCWMLRLRELVSDEKSLFQRLLVSPYFDHFERLAIGFYAFNTNLSNFGDFVSETDVAQYLQSIQQYPNYINWLKNALMDVNNKNYPAISGDPITLLIFVSDIEENEVSDATEQAKQLQDQGVRVVLVGHGDFEDDFVNLDRLTRVTGDPSTALKWDDKKSLPADDYQT